MNREPLWIEALDMQASALRFSRWMAAVKNPSADLNPRLVTAASASANILGHCSVLAWHDEPATAAQLASRTVPDDSSIAMVPLPEGLVNMWWYFERPIELGLLAGEAQQIPEPGADLDQTRLAAVLLSARPYQGQALPTLTMVVYRPVHITIARPTTRRLDLIPTLVVVGEVENTVAQARQYLKDQTSADNIARIEAFASLTRFIIAGCTWLHQRIAIVRCEPIERHARKRLAREFALEAPTDVRVISLRRQESAPHDAGDGRVVDWRWRWVVSGHWRKQAVKDGHRLTYINPYMKGPDDRPLKPPSTTVYEVKR